MMMSTPRRDVARDNDDEDEYDDYDEEMQQSSRKRGHGDHNELVPASQKRRRVPAFSVSLMEREEKGGGEREREEGG